MITQKKFLLSLKVLNKFSAKSKIKSNRIIKNISILFALVLIIPVCSQEVRGVVKDSQGVLPFVNIIELGTQSGTISDKNGNFQLTLKNNPSTLVFSSIGYETVTKRTNGGDILKIILEEGNQLEEVVITGNRSKPRTIVDSPVPIDNIGVAELQETGKTTIDQMLAFTVPSYNATNQTVSDATAHFDPADLRGLGPSRTLVLINGKRKNQSALVYTSDTPGKGEVGTDYKSIPISAIKNIEVLRDGASSQYGSDAVAGVINIILKKKVKFTEVNINSGITQKGDGFNFGADVNHTFTFGAGFVNASLSGSHQKSTNRSGNPGKDVIFNIDNEWTKKNPNLGMIIGQPETTKGNAFVNAEYPLNEYVSLYTFGGYNYRKGKSFALYRAPYWVKDPYNLLHEKGAEYNGFQPTFETDIQDVFLTTGSTFKLFGFNADLSATYGSNDVVYTIGNTLNRSLGANSPTKFNGGAFSFSNILGDFDLNRTFGNLTVGAGIEARREVFVVTEGQEESYIGEGAQSFPGLQPQNSLSENRTNIGAYFTSDWDVTDKLLLAGATRYENFSDFGANLSWKLSSRYKLNKSGTLRASYSTGFRAPSLHQIHYNSVITLPGVNGKIINQGNFKNTDKVVKDLGVKKLFAETSRNFSIGFTVKTKSKLVISLDYYNVEINDRVLLAGQISENNDNGVVDPNIKNILSKNNVSALTFFFNTLNTRTQGFDYSIRYDKISVGKGKLGLNTSLNINQTSLDGKINVPEKLKSYTKTIFNREEQSRVTSARPNLKFIFGTNYKIQNLKIAINNTYFDKVTWKHSSDPKKDQIFSGKTLTDLTLGYEVSDKVSVNINVNNLFNVYPDKIDPKGDPGTNLGGRFKYPWEVNQFGFNGAGFKAGLRYKF